jgi:hypothetical protein
MKISLTNNRVITGATTVLRFPIESMQANGDKIIVCCPKDSVSVYKFDLVTKSFRFLKSDRYTRNILSTVVIDDELVVACSKKGTLYGLKIEAGIHKYCYRL